MGRRQRVRWIAATTALVACTPAATQTQPQAPVAADLREAPNEVARWILMRGTAKGRIPLEVANVRVVVAGQAETFAGAAQEVRRRGEAVRAALVDAGAEAVRVAPRPTERLAPTLEKGKLSMPGSGGPVEVYLWIDVEDLPLAKLRAVVDAAIGAGAEIDRISTGPRDRAEARARLRAAAVEEARRRATVLAASVGASLGPVLEIDTTAEGLLSGQWSHRIRPRDLEDADFDPADLAPETRCTVLVRFALE